MDSCMFYEFLFKTTDTTNLLWTKNGILNFNEYQSMAEVGGMLSLAGHGKRKEMTLVSGTTGETARYAPRGT